MNVKEPLQLASQDHNKRSLYLQETGADYVVSMCLLDYVFMLLAEPKETKYVIEFMIFMSIDSSVSKVKFLKIYYFTPWE